MTARPVVVILLMLALAVGLGTRIPHLILETSTEDYLFENDPALVAYDAFREQFGRDQPVLIAVEPPEVFNLEFLAWLEALHRDLENSVPYLSDLTSLVNVRSVWGDGDELQVDDLLESMPDSAASLSALKERVRATESYQDAVISSDGRIAVLVAEADAYSSITAPGDDTAFSGFESTDAPPRIPLTGVEITDFCNAVFEVVDRHAHPDYEVRISGQPLITYTLTRAMVDDMPQMFAAAMIVIGLLIAALFRRFTPVWLSAAIVVLSLSSTIGIAELLGIAFGLPAQILPTFVLAIGVGYAVHLFSLFYRGTAHGQDRLAAIEAAFRHAGMPIAMTAVTTTAGLLSFLAAEMQPVADLGRLGAIAVAVTWLYSMTVLPAALSLLPLRAGSIRGVEGGARFLTACARLSVESPRVVVGIVAVLAILSLTQLPKLEIGANPVEYFPETHDLRRSVTYADQRLGGIQTVEIVVDTGHENGLYEPDNLAILEDLDQLMAEVAASGEAVGQAFSVLEVVKETHQALNENRAEFYAVPADRLLIAQELLLFENSGADDLEDLVDTGFSKARISVRTSWEDGVEKLRFLQALMPQITDRVAGRAEVSITGGASLVARVATATLESMLQSYTLALALITPLMILLIGSLRSGLVSMVPNLVPILMTMAFVILIGERFDVFTMLGGCIAIGLAVDDSIHFISSFRRDLALSGDPIQAVERTMETTGRALLFTTIVLVSGFLVLGLSSMENFANLGWITAMAIALAFVLDVTVTPALLVLTHGASREASRVTSQDTAMTSAEPGADLGRDQ